MSISPFENSIPAYPSELTSQEILTLEQQAKLNQLYQTLKKIDDSGNQLSLNNLIAEGEKTVNKALYLYQITRLDLGHCGLTAVPPGVEELVNLEKLNLFDNNLMELPSELVKLSKLREVRIGCNELEEIPSVLYQMAIDCIANGEVFSLFLANNAINKVPKSIQHVVRTMPNCNSYFSESAPCP